jgi:hypothetical protein
MSLDRGIVWTPVKSRAAAFDSAWGLVERRLVAEILEPVRERIGADELGEPPVGADRGRGR